MSDKSIKPPATSNSSLSAAQWSSLKQNKLIFNQKTVVSIYIMYEINICQLKKQRADFTLGKFLSITEKRFLVRFLVTF